MLLPGTEIEGYRIQHLLGRGGMGEVYEATQITLDRTVALKILHRRLSADPEFKERFRREGRLQAALDHPNVVPVYEAGELEDGLFIAMKLIRGRTLKQLIEAGELNTTQTLSILTPIARALDAAHQAGVVHRDIKPQNILVESGDHSYLADFGLTRETAETSTLTQTGQFQGTIDYVAPEQVHGEPADAASDIYSFAAVVYECLTGSIPYPRSSDAAVLYAHVNDPPPSVLEARADLTAEVDEVIARGLAKEGAERFESASGMMTSLDAALDQRDASATRSKSTTRPTSVTARRTAETVIAGSEPPPRPGRRRLILGTGTALVIAALTAAAFAIGKSGGESAVAAGLPVSASSDALELSLPDGWQRTTPDQTVSIPGLAGLRDEIAATPTTGDGSGVLAGIGAAAGPSLLPADLIEAAGEGLPVGQPVRLGDGDQALLYEDVSVDGFDRELDIYAIPATTGVATVSCYAAATGGEAVENCYRIADSLRLNGAAETLPLAVPAKDYSRVSEVTETLNRGRVAGRRALRKAKRPTPQAEAAREVAKAYRRGAKQYRQLNLHPTLMTSVAALAGTAGQTASSYSDLADAIAKQDQDAFARAGTAATKDEAAFERALKRFNEGGGR